MTPSVCAWVIATLVARGGELESCKVARETDTYLSDKVFRTEHAQQNK